MTGRTIDMFTNLGDLYGELWVREYGYEPNDAFIRLAEGLTDAQSKRVYQNCRDKFVAGDKWPPNLGLLMAYSITPPESELRLILGRILAKKPENDIERWIARKADFELRRCQSGKEMKLLREWYIRAEELAMRGELYADQEELLALPSHSVKNVNDIAREQWESSGKTHRLQARIEALRKENRG